MRLRVRSKDDLPRRMMRRLSEISGIRIVGGHDALIVEIEEHASESFMRQIGDVATVTPA